jgi:hypothetical protein
MPYMTTTDESKRRYSLASIARQAAIPPEVRKARAIAAGKARWAGKTQRERRAHALNMVKARQWSKKNPK